MLLITFMQNEFINTTVLPDKKNGRYKVNNSIPDLEEDINIDGAEGKWLISSGDTFTVSKLSGKDKVPCYDRTELKSGDVFTVGIGDREYTLIVGTLNDERNKFTKFCFASDKVQSIGIGKKEDNDIVLDDSYISGGHAIISKKDDSWYVRDCRSKNGTYVNNRRIAEDEDHPLEIGDVVFIVGYKFVICADFIAANIDFDGNVRGNKLKKVVFREFKRSQRKNNGDEINYFYRTIDLGEQKPEFAEIELLPPEKKQVKDEQSALLSMGSAITMSTASVLVAAYSGIAAYYRGTNISYVVPSFIMAGSMVLSSLVWPSKIKKHMRKDAAKKEKERISDYQAYIMQLRDAVSVMKDEEKKYLCRKYLTVDECMKRVITRDRYLWSKSINDEDFMSVAIGTGQRESSVKIKNNVKDEAFFKDDLRYDMMQFSKEERVINDAPITISLNDGCICGISGEKQLSCELIKEIVIQLTALYSYDELKLIFICSREDEEKWAFAKWLPHVWNSDNTFRYIAASSDEIKELSYELEKEIENRTERKNDDFPKMLIIASDKKRMDSIDIMPVIIKNRKALNISLLTSFGLYNYNNSDMIIELAENGSKLYDRGNNTVSEFMPCRLGAGDGGAERFDTFLDMISNIKLDISTEKYQLPKMLTFMDMFKVSKVEHLNSPTRWAENNPIKSLKTAIGVAPSGDTFYIDLHEKFHGPHGLIAGTTGSGKSETIITVILSLAVNYSPDEVAFVIIDYKGGGLADAFNDTKEEIVDGQRVEVTYKLPHVVGTVTNLDGATIERARISIETELKRRQTLFKTARKLSNEGTMDIYKYQQLRREGADLEPLPHLFIVCDEFAELKADRAEFMDLLVSAARIGRSLGVHLVLATQKPDSVVSPQIWSNSRFKICLKVQGREDSKAVIHCPDAAEISTTGRFFFQVGYNEVFSMGQSAWCGADYVESEEFIKNDVESIEIISNTGAVLYEKSRKPDIIAAVNDKKPVSQLITVRNYLIDIAKDMDIRPLWLEPIPAKLSIRELYREAESGGEFTVLEPVIGKRDDLYNRIQEIMTVPFTEKGNLIVYGAAGSGLDMFFITLMYSLIYNYTAEQVNLYVLDFDAGFLKTFEKAPHVGDVITAENDEDISTVLNFVRDEINRRSKLFSEYRGEYSEYCRLSGNKLPNVVVILNNYTEFVEKADDNDVSNLVYIAREGVKRGIYVVIGTSSVNTNYRLKQYIQQIYMLRMNDVNDYIGILGRTGGITPSDCVGSGIVKENDITYKFQIADIFDVIPKSDDEPVDNDAAKEIKLLCDDVTANYDGAAAPSCRSASAYEPTETADTANAPNTADIASDNSGTPLGRDEKGVFRYDLSSKYITFVSSMSAEMLTGFADYLARNLSEDDSIDVEVLDPSGMITRNDSAYSCYTTLDEFREFNNRYKTIAETRCGLLVKRPDGGYEMSSDEKHIFVIINSFEDAASIADSNVTLNNLKSIINELPEIHIHYIILDTPRKMHGERGAYFHIVKNVADITDFSMLDVENNREWFDDSGIWLGSGFASSGFFEVTNGRFEPSQAEGLIVRNRLVEKKFTYFK